MGRTRDDGNEVVVAGDSSWSSDSNRLLVDLVAWIFRMVVLDLRMTMAATGPWSSYAPAMGMTMFSVVGDGMQ